jgi:hypothetical protein
MKRTFVTCSVEEIESLTKKKYAASTMRNIQTYENLLTAFLATKNVTVIPSDPSSLNDLLCEFWPSIRTSKNEEYSANSLCTMRHLLRTLILKKTDVDILLHPSLKPQYAVFDNVLKKLKDIGKGTIKHYPEIPSDDMKKIISTLDSSNPTELQYLAWWYVQLFFCRRGRENTQEMKKSDLVFEEVEGSLTIRLGRILSTKNHKEVNEDADSGGLICEMKGHSKCPVQTLKFYISKLNAGIEWLWQKPTAKLVSPKDSCWYERSKVGCNKLSEMMKNISLKCSLSKSFTNHCIRVSTCTLLGELGFTDIDIQAVSKHKSVDSLAVYKRTKMARKMDMATKMSHFLGLCTIPTSTSPAASASSNLQETAHSTIPSTEQEPPTGPTEASPRTDADELGSIFPEHLLDFVTNDALLEPDFPVLTQYHELEMPVLTPNVEFLNVPGAVHQSVSRVVEAKRPRVVEDKRQIIIQNCTGCTINL